MSILGHDGANRPEQTVEGQEARRLTKLLRPFKNKGPSTYSNRELRKLEASTREIHSLKEKRLNTLSNQMSMSGEASPIDRVFSLEITSQNLAADIIVLCERLEGCGSNNKLNFGFVKDSEKTRINGNPQHFNNAEQVEHHEHSELSKFMAASYESYSLNDSLQLYEELKIVHSVIHKLFRDKDMKSRMNRKTEFTASAD